MAGLALPVHTLGFCGRLYHRRRGELSALPFAPCLPGKRHCDLPQLAIGRARIPLCAVCLQVGAALGWRAAFALEAVAMVPLAALTLLAAPVELHSGKPEGESAAGAAGV